VSEWPQVSTGYLSFICADNEPYLKIINSAAADITWHAICCDIDMCCDIGRAFAWIIFSEISQHPITAANAFSWIIDEILHVFLGYGRPILGWAHQTESAALFCYINMGFICMNR
jgi:hypothetical protein